MSEQAVWWADCPTRDRSRTDVLRVLDLGRWVTGVAWPASRADLLDRLREKQAADGLVGSVSRLPNRRYVDLHDLAAQLGIPVERSLQRPGRPDHQLG